jgi:hypothetical protein
MQDLKFSPDQREMVANLFKTLSSATGRLSGADAAMFFRKSNLPDAVLFQVAVPLLVDGVDLE